MRDDERRMAERLQLYESQVPDTPDPPMVALGARPPWGAIAAIGAAAVLGIAILANYVANDRPVGEADPTPTVTAGASATPRVSPTATATPAVTYDDVPTVAPSTPAPTPIPTSPPLGASNGVTWNAGSFASLGGTVQRATAENGRFYALGSSERLVAAIWSSSDGVSWQRTELPYPVSWAGEGEAGSLHAHELATVGGRLVALGTIARDDRLDVIAWSSTDGQSWEEIDTGPFRTAGIDTYDLTNGPAGLVTISHRYEAGTGSTWRSADGGRTWTEHQPPGDAPTLHAVVGTARGYLIAGAVGETFDEGQTLSPRIWFSNDGMTWTAATIEGSNDTGRVEQLAIDGSGTWVATGTLNDGAVVWRSTDRGLSWKVAATLGPAEPSHRAGYRLAGAPDGFIAISPNDPAVTWRSTDGVTWAAGSPVTFDPDGATTLDWASGIARIGQTLVVGGHTYQVEGPIEPFGRVWVGTIQR